MGNFFLCNYQETTNIDARFPKGQLQFYLYLGRPTQGECDIPQKRKSTTDERERIIGSWIDRSVMFILIGDARAIPLSSIHPFLLFLPFTSIPRRSALSAVSYDSINCFASSFPLITSARRALTSIYKGTSQVK